MNALNLLILGNGHYTSGLTSVDQATDKDNGVLLPSALALQATGEVAEIHLAAVRGAKFPRLREKIAALAARHDWRPDVKTYPADDTVDENAFTTALANIPRPAAALIAVPDGQHLRLATACLEAGLPVFVVKPVVTSWTDYKTLTAALATTGQLGVVDYHKAFDDANLLIRRKLADGALGDLQLVQSWQTQKRIMRTIFASWLDGATNINHYLGSHYIHLTSWLTGAWPVRVSAQAHPHGTKPGAADLIETGIRWRMPGGKTFSSSHVAGWNDPNQGPAMTFQEMRFFGSAGYLASDQRDRGLQILAGDEGWQTPNPYFFSDHGGLEQPNPFAHMYGHRSVRTFVGCAARFLADGAEPGPGVPTVADSGAVTLALEAADRSLAQDGAPVEVSELVQDGDPCPDWLF